MINFYFHIYTHTREHYFCCLILPLMYVLLKSKSASINKSKQGITIGNLFLITAKKLLPLKRCTAVLLVTFPRPSRDAVEGTGKWQEDDWCTFRSIEYTPRKRPMTLSSTFSTVLFCCLRPNEPGGVRRTALWASKIYPQTHPAHKSVVALLLRLRLPLLLLLLFRKCRFLDSVPPGDVPATNQISIFGLNVYTGIWIVRSQLYTCPCWPESLPQPPSKLWGWRWLRRWWVEVKRMSPSVSDLLAQRCHRNAADLGAG